MTGTAARRQLERATVRTDEQLIKSCLDGQPEAWSELIEKYKNLIYSVPIRLGMYQDAGDIFQAVCLNLLSNLSQLREHRALPKWLMQTCYHECLSCQRANSRHTELSPAEAETIQAEVPGDILVQLEQEQVLREAIREMPPRCERMIRMLFFEIPARSYAEVARELGLATGSIGFIRSRCLDRLRKHLEMKGF